MKENICAGIAILSIIITCILLFITFSDTKFKLPKINISNSNSTEKSKKDEVEKNKTSSKNTLVCTKTEVDEDGFETKSTMTINYKNNKVTKIKQEDLQTLDEESVDFVYGFGSLFMMAFSQIDGINATYEKVDSVSIKGIVEIDYTKLDFDALKQAIDDINSEGGETEKSILTESKEFSLDELKQNYLDGYICN